VTNNGVAIITGGSSGIGLEFARQLAAKGCNLLLIARHKAELENAAAQLKKDLMVDIETMATNLAEETNLPAVCRKIEQYQNISYLINNAGTTYLGHFNELEIEKHTRLMTLHMSAPVYLTHSALKVMATNKKGIIINVASFSAFMNQIPTTGLYGPTKSFLVSFSRTLRSSLQGQNIQVQVLCPGYTYTNFHKSEEFTSRNMDVYNKIPQAMWMKCDEVVRQSLAASPNKFIVIPGFINRLFLFVMNLPFAAVLFKNKQ
jgi:uncharacterized protein